MIRKIGRTIAVLVIVSSFSIEKAHAGAWTVPKYKVYVEDYMKWGYAKDQFIADGGRKRLNNDGRSWDWVNEPKIEYGITDWLNFLGAIEYKEEHYKEYGRQAGWGPFSRKNHGFTNVKLGGKLRIVEQPVVTSLQTKVFIYPGYGVDHGDDRTFSSNQPSIGYGDNAVEERVLMGKTFSLPILPRYSLPCYWGMETGYRWRTRHVCNDIPYFVEGGFWPVNWLLVKSEIDGYKSHDGTGSIESSYGTWRIGGIWQVFGDATLRKGAEIFNLEFQYGMTLWGKNTSAYNEFVFKVATQF